MEPESGGLCHMIWAEFGVAPEEFIIMSIYGVEYWSRVMGSKFILKHYECRCNT